MQAIVLKKLRYKESIGWLIAETTKPVDADIAMQIVKAINSSISNRPVKYTGDLMTAFGGFFLLSRDRSLYQVHRVMNTLELEGASSEGMKLAAALLGAVVGKDVVENTMQ